MNTMPRATRGTSGQATRIRLSLGLSLIELMVAIALGALLLLGLVQIFSGVRTTFGTSEALSRIQENARFALEFLRRDLRMVGHFGCMNEFSIFPRVDRRNFARSGIPGFSHLLVADGTSRDAVPWTLRPDIPIEVYDYSADATSPGDDYTISSPSPAGVTAASSWTPALPAALSALLGDAIPGSDVVVARYFDEEVISVNSMLTAGEFRILDGAEVQEGGQYGFTNCTSFVLLHASDADSAAGTLTADAPANRVWDQGANPVYENDSLFRYRVVAYYVGRGVNGPALKRLTLPENGTAAVNSAADVVMNPSGEELVEGIEMLQVLLGVTNDNERLTDQVATYVSGAELLGGVAAGQATEAALRQISSVRVSLLARGNNSRAGIGAVPGTHLVGEVRVTPPADERLRQVYDSHIALRNRIRD